MLILVQRPQHKSTTDSVGAPKKNPFAAILIEVFDTKKCYTFSGLELVPKSYLAVSAACTKAKSAFISFGTIRKKLLLMKTTKDARYVRPLGNNPHFGAYTEAKNVLRMVRCAKHAPHVPKNNANPLGLSEKNVYCVKNLLFCRQGEVSFLRGVG